LRRLPYSVPATEELSRPAGFVASIAVRRSALTALLLLCWPASARADDVERGAYLANAADCAACHTDIEHKGARYAGGRALATPFGTFYPPNITPDPETGIGRWTDAQFLRAMRHGERPDGANYFPAFPYTSFTGILDDDVRAIKAYLFSLPPVRHVNRPHDLSFPYSWRFLLNGWKLLYFDEGPFRPAPGRSAEQNRGAYLVTALAHCGECHTPRNWFGAMDQSRFLGGNPEGPDGKKVPNITPDKKIGIGNWSTDDIVQVLTDGHTPDFDEVGFSMAEVVKSTAKLTEQDRRAIAVFLQSVPPVSSPPRR
jgi:mono/diheme cytochrome c family protein